MMIVLDIRSQPARGVLLVLLVHENDKHMGQFLQGGKNGRLMSFFYHRQVI